MITQVTCNEVFDVLTRGPFPSGLSTDESVEHHLRACHECRELAEALRPAVGLFHEAIDSSEFAELPSYRGAMRARSESPMPWEPRPLAGNGLSSRFLRMAAVAACVFIACGLAFGAGHWTKKNVGPVSPTTLSAGDEGGVLSCDTEPVCVVHGQFQGRCCTECHGASQAQTVGKAPIVALVRACHDCHLDELDSRQTEAS